jgi:hypothetical protein
MRGAQQEGAQTRDRLNRRLSRLDRQSRLLFRNILSSAPGSGRSGRPQLRVNSTFGQNVWKSKGHRKTAAQLLSKHTPPFFVRPELGANEALERFP